MRRQLLLRNALPATADRRTVKTTVSLKERCRAKRQGPSQSEVEGDNCDCGQRVELEPAKAIMR